MTGSDSILNTDFFRSGLSGRNFWLTEEVKSSIINSYKINGKEKTDVSADNNSCAIDTHKDNKITRHLIEKNGFAKCGIIYVADGSPRIAYEKQII